MLRVDRTHGFKGGHRLLPPPVRKADLARAEQIVQHRPPLDIGQLNVDVPVVGHRGRELLQDGSSAEPVPAVYPLHGIVVLIGQIQSRGQFSRQLREPRK